MKSTRIDRNFFERDTLEVVPALLGQRLVFGSFRGVVTEAEAYVGQGDPACHAAVGKTPRTVVMFGPPGHAYVYLIYGMHHCLNVVTEKEGFPAAILIRGLLLDESLGGKHLDGPGKLCRALGITRDQNSLDMITDETLYFEHTGLQPDYVQTPRIGISKAKEWPWRFLVLDIEGLRRDRDAL